MSSIGFHPGELNDSLELQHHTGQNHVIAGSYIRSGFPKVGFANTWWFVRELQGVRELVHSMPKSVYH